MLRPNEQRLADAIADFAAEHGLPNSVTFGKLVTFHRAPAPARRAGLVWAKANVSIPAALRERGIIVTREGDGKLSLTQVQ